MKGFNREDSSILGFITLCYSMQAITNEEFKEYFYSLIKSSDVDELPDYIWDLIEFINPDMADIYNVIGFVPSSNLTDDEINAIYGITLKRFGRFFDMFITEGKAIELLNNNPKVSSLFKTLFPFVHFY